jgi:hypothetical protein
MLSLRGSIPAKAAAVGTSQPGKIGGRTMENIPARKKTRTCPFGMPGSVFHDSSPFYVGRLYSFVPKIQACEYVENPVPPEYIDTILGKSSEAMAELPDHSVHLMVTSPPYNVGKEYDRDLTLEEYPRELQARGMDYMDFSKASHGPPSL